MNHTKKILSKYFEAVCNGSKPFEIRKEDDCGYEIGDLIELVEIEEITYEVTFAHICTHLETEFEATGRKQLVRVTYRLDSTSFPDAIKDGYVVLGIKLVNNFDSCKHDETEKGNIQYDSDHEYFSYTERCKKCNRKRDFINEELGDWCD